MLTLGMRTSYVRSGGPTSGLPLPPFPDSLAPAGSIRPLRPSGEIRKLAEECGDLVQVDARFFTVALGDADTHRGSEAGGGVSEQISGDDGVADQVELGLDRDSGQSHRRVLIHFPEYGELARRRDLIDMGLQSLTISVPDIFNQPRDGEALQARLDGLGHLEE